MVPLASETWRIAAALAAIETSFLLHFRRIDGLAQVQVHRGI
jgi:hypothetical protein